MRYRNWPVSRRLPPNRPMMARSVRWRSARAPSASLTAPSAAGGQRARRRGHRAPHVLAQGLGQPVQIVVLQERPVALLEVERAVGHLGQHAAAGRTDHPLARLPLGQRPGRHLAGRPVGQHPVGPVLGVQREAAAQLDRVHAEAVQHVLVDDGQLLHGVVDADGPRRQTQSPTELAIGDGRDARRAMAAEVDRHPIRLAVLQGGKKRAPAGSWHSPRRMGKLMATVHGLECIRHTPCAARRSRTPRCGRSPPARCGRSPTGALWPVSDRRVVAGLRPSHTAALKVSRAPETFGRRRGGVGRPAPELGRTEHGVCRIH